MSSTRRLADEDLLEAALQGGVLLDPLAVLVERGRADHPQLAAGQHRLEHVAGVHRGVAAGARPDDGVQLVDEGDDLALGVLDLGQHGLEPLLELAAVLRARDHRREVEGEQPTALSESGTSPSTIRWARPSTTAVLPTPGSPISTGLFLVRRDSTWTTRRISASRPMTGSSLPSAADGGEVDGVLLERLVGRLRVLAGDPGRRRARGQGAAQRSAVAPAPRQQLRPGESTVGERDQQVLGGDEVVLHLRGEVVGAASGLRSRRGSTTARRPSSPRRRAAGRTRPGPRPTAPGCDADGLEQRADDALVLAEQRGEQVHGLDLGCARGGGGLDGGVDRLLAAGGELRCVHGCSLDESAGDGAPRRATADSSRRGEGGRQGRPRRHR